MLDPEADRHQRQHRHYLQCLREVRFVTVAWVITAIYVSVMCGRYGYIPVADRPDEPFLIFGIPGWVLVGVIAPWIVLIGVTWWFAM
ncbi:MAG: hypothetical protein O3A00_14780, partial [Planctomycetota bacterium]|nr:hypothetical protein [Planctomycetota bacterium]